MAPTLVEHVVADAGAFLKKAPLQVRVQRVRVDIDVLLQRLHVCVPDAACWDSLKSNEAKLTQANVERALCSAMTATALKTEFMLFNFTFMSTVSMFSSTERTVS